MSYLRNELLRKEAIAMYSSLLLGVQYSSANNNFTTTKKKLVQIFLNGGLSHLDSFDPKRNNPDIMGATKTMPTNTGELISSYFPMLSKRMDKLALIRSMSTTEGDHGRAMYLTKTSYAPIGTIKHPSLGSWMEKFNGKLNANLPASINIQTNGSSGYLGSQYEPFKIRFAQQPLRDLIMKDPKSPEKIEYLNLISDVKKEFYKTNKFRSSDAYLKYYNKSIKLLQSEDLDAFNIKLENKLRYQKYEIPNGASFLLAKRLLQANVQYVALRVGGDWDDHNDLWAPDQFPSRAKNLDRALSIFIDDLSDSGLLKNTVFSICTEFGRTPKIQSRKGRDHHRKAYSCLLGGAGVKTGTIYGKSDDRGMKVVENPVSPADYNATIATLLNMNLEKEVYSSDNRPFTIARGGQPIKELLI